MIVPIAGIILTFVMCYELIEMIVEKNNMHDFDSSMFFRWIFKTFCAVLIVTNTWNIVMAVFDVAQNVVSQSAGVIISDAGIDISGVVGDLETQLADWSVGALLGMGFFRHKTRHWTFRLGMPAILILQVAALTAWTYWDVFLR